MLCDYCGKDRNARDVVRLVDNIYVCSNKCAYNYHSCIEKGNTWDRWFRDSDRHTFKYSWGNYH